MNNKEVNKRKNIFNIIGMLLFITICGVILIILLPKIKEYIDDPLLFKEYINDKGIKGVFIFLALQILQIVVSIIPGEFVEVAAGITYGWFFGFVLCEIGIFIGSSFIYFFSKKIGKPAVKNFVGDKHFDKLSKLDNYKNRDRIIFLIYLVPGLPKDLLSYVACFFSINYSKFMIISMVARIPSILTSTIAGSYLINGDYLEAVLIFVFTGLFALVCFLLSDKIMNKISKHKESKNYIGEKDEI